MVAQKSPPVEGIVLVPKDGPLRDFCRDCMKQNGIRAVEALDSLEVVLIAASRKNPIDVLVTDHENPEVSGIGLSAMLESISPQVKVVILSGSFAKKRLVADYEIRHLKEVRSPSGSHETRRVVTGR